jgi:hypothetical protein
MNAGSRQRRVFRRVSPTTAQSIVNVAYWNEESEAE